MDCQAIDRELNKKILSQINWRHGILPSGDIATDPCFVLREMPIIKLFVIEQETIQPILVTQSDWTSNLVHSGAIYNLHDDSTLRALSDCQLIFHRLEKPQRKTLHLLNFETVAWFRVDDILQSTTKFQDALDDALQYWPNDPAKAWQGLCKVWTVYGFLWPQKIMLGHRRHVKQVYKVTTAEEGVHIQHFRQAHASDEASAQMHAELSSNYHSEGRRQQAAWDIIKRSDIRPLHEFLQKQQRDVIVDMISVFVHRIPVHRPIKLRSLCTSGYLGWRQQSQKGNKSSGATIRFATLPVHAMQASRSNYLWRLEWSALNSPRRRQRQQIVEAVYEPAYIRCSSRVYLYPITTAPTEMHRSPSAVTQQQSDQMALTRVGVPNSPLSHRFQERLRGLELVDVSDDDTSQHQWTIEMQGLGLEHDDDISTDMGRNVDIEIGRRKPVLHGDIIALRQVHYLCCSPKTTDIPNNALFRPSPPLPPSIAPSMLPVVAATDVSPLSNSSASVPSSSGISSPPQCSTANTSTSNNNSPSKFATFLPHFTSNNHTPPQDHMHPVLAKEVDMIRPGTVEQLWIVEIAMPEDLQYHHTGAAPMATTTTSNTAALAAAATATTTTTVTRPTDLPHNINDASNSSSNVIRRKKSLHDLKVSGDITNLRKKKSMHDFRPSREQDDRDAVVQIKAMISAESLPRGNTPLSARKVRSLTDLVYDLERQPTMEDIETSGSLSFQPPGTDTVESSPARYYNADDLDVCASARAEHFIRLYASRQHRKRWSHLIKAGTFSRFGSGK